MKTPGAPARTCARCSRSFTGKAGRMVKGQPMCPSCGNATRPAIPCASCGRPTKRPGRSSCHHGLVCEGCRLEATHATCRSCRRHRRVARLDDGDRPLCAACGADQAVTHACPDCGGDQPGAGRARCPACALARRIASRAASIAPEFRQEWVRELFLTFCASIDAASARGDIARRLPRHAEFFAELDRRCAGIPEITQRRLLGLFGADGLRRADLPVRFLIRQLTLSWDAELAHANSERRRIAATSASARDQHWSVDLEAYRKYLGTGRELAPETTRMYLATASALLRAAGVARAAELTQARVRRYLRRFRGRRTNIMRFLSWIAVRAEASFDVGNARRTPPRKRERATLQRAGHLLDRLEDIRDPREGRAVLAAAIAVVHRIPLTKVLALRLEEVAEDGTTILHRGEEVVGLASPLVTALARFRPGSGTFVFPGRNAAQTLTISTVRHHTEKSGADRTRIRTVGANVNLPSCCPGPNVGHE